MNVKRTKQCLFRSFLFFSGLLIAMVTSAQQFTVRGTVKDATGEPVIGANVMVKGTSNGTITDIDGKYSVSDVNSSSVLVFTFIGYKNEEMACKGQHEINVILSEDLQTLDEVVVVGYGSLSKKELSSSIVQVDKSQFQQGAMNNPMEMLTGKVAGLNVNNTASANPNSGSSLQIRGATSITASNDPLIVIDGIAGGDIRNLSSQDIESMTVLKDAASNALYGARGANGVIMITTKKGNAGQATVTVDAKWGVNTRATQDYNIVTSPAQYYEMYYGALKGYFMNGQNMSEYNAHVMANNNMTNTGSYGLGYNIYSVPAGQYLIGENGKLNANATLGNIVSYKGQEYLLRPDNWLDAAYKSSLRQEYNVSVSAGSDKSSFYASFNYLDNEGITANSDFERLTGRLRADYQVKPWLKVGANMSYAHFESNSLSEDGSSGSSGNIFAIATQVAPIYPLFMRDGAGNIMQDSNGITRYDYGDGLNGGAIRPFLSNSNAISGNLLDKNYAEGNAINAVGFFEIRFLKDFKFTSTNSVNVAESRISQVTNPYYGGYATSNGIAYKYHVRDFAYNYQQLLNYKKSFGSHNLEVMLGHESYRYKYYYLSANKSNMFDPTNSELAGAVTDGSANSYTTDYNTEGYFGRIQYDFSEKYFASGSYRRDASSRFHPDNRWGNFWSLSGAWMMSKEDWFDIDWIDEFKLKASYGSQGNDNIGNYRYTNTYEIVNSSGNPAAVPKTL